MDTMLSLMSIAHQEPQGRSYLVTFFFRPEKEAIFRWNIGWMHMHFVGVRWKCCRLFWDSLWSAAAMAAVQLWSAFLADVCVQTFTPGSFSMRLSANPSCTCMQHYSCNCRTYMLALCGDVCLYVILVLLRFAQVLCVFQENFSAICSTTLVVSVCVCVCVVCVCVCCLLWCNIVFKGKGKYRKSWKESTNVQRKTWTMISLCVY